MKKGESKRKHDIRKRKRKAYWKKIRRLAGAVVIKVSSPGPTGWINLLGKGPIDVYPRRRPPTAMPKEAGHG